MATIEIKCPGEIAPSGKIWVYTKITETLPFEFASCGEQMVVSYILDGEKVLVERVKPHIPQFWGDVADFYVQITAPNKSGIYTLEAQLTGAGSLWPLGSCNGEAKASCTIVVREGAPEEGKPIGVPPPPPNWMPYILIGGAILVVAGLLYYEQQKGFEEMLALAR